MGCFRRLGLEPALQRDLARLRGSCRGARAKRKRNRSRAKGNKQRARPRPPRRGQETERPGGKTEGKAQGGKEVKISSKAYLDGAGCSKGSASPSRCFVCGCMGGRYGQCPCKAVPKPKGGHWSLAEVAEEVSEGSWAKHQGAAVSMCQAGTREWPHDHFLFNSVANHVRLPAG